LIRAFKSPSADDLWVRFVVTELCACGSQVSEASSPWAFEHFAHQGVELIQIDRVSQQRNIGDQRAASPISMDARVVNNTAGTWQSHDQPAGDAYRDMPV
jgi:hypothetical protein